MKEIDRKNNIHIPYEQQIQPYHYKVADLVCQYIQDEGSILDIGTGVGHTIAQIRKKKPDTSITAVDIDPYCLKIAQERALVNEIVQIEKFDDLRTMPLKYDVIVMSHVLEHLTRPVDAVHLVIGMLNPGGILVLAVPNLVTPTIIVSNFRKQHYVNRGHVCSWDRSHWMNFLENILKVNVVCYSQDYVPLPVLWKFDIFRPVLYFLAKLFPWFSNSNIAVIKN